MLTRRLLLTLLTGVAALSLAVLAISTGSAPVAAQSGVCLQGYVPRLANPQDRVCVTPQTRAQVVADNESALPRRAPGKNDACVTGYVWREANAQDHICVTPQTREQTQLDNASASSRLASAVQGGRANAQCTILSAQDFGKIVPFALDPAPVEGLPCRIAGEAGFVSSTSASASVDLNAVCQITSSAGASIAVPYHGNPAPALGTPCAVGAFKGIISRTSATAPVTQ